MAAVCADSGFVSAEELLNWHNTFKMFDRDGGGDVDLKELGLMFRQLGYSPSGARYRVHPEGQQTHLTTAADLADQMPTCPPSSKRLTATGAGRLILRSFVFSCCA